MVSVGVRANQVAILLLQAPKTNVAQPKKNSRGNCVITGTKNKVAQHRKKNQVASL